MLDNLKDSRLEELNENLEQINRKLGNFWYSFIRGVLTGFGSILGAGLAIILIGWFLNIVGVIPAFQKQADEWRNVFQQTQNNKSYLPTNNE